jgi:hypothetical protein
VRAAVLAGVAVVVCIIAAGCGSSNASAPSRVSSAHSARITFLQYATLRLTANIDPTAAAKARTLATFNQGIPWLINLCKHEPHAVTIGGKTVEQRVEVELKALAYSPQADARAKVRAAVENHCS